jgi:phosphate-selective porin
MSIPPLLGPRAHVRIPALIVGVLLGVLLLAANSNAQSHQPPDMATKRSPKKFEFSTYFQLRLTANENSPDLYALRRFKVIFHGNLTPHFEYYVQGIFKDGNASETDGRAYLQDAWARYAGWKYARVTIGQFKPPFGMELFTPDWQLFTLERSEATNRLVPDGQLGDSFTRDRGVQLDSWLDRNRFYYAVGVFDGNGANQAFRGNGPLVAGRIERVLYQAPTGSSRPARVWVGAAASTRGDHDQNFASALTGTAALGYTHFSGKDTRLDLDASADYGPASCRAEYLYTWFEPRGATLPEVQADGYYAEIAWRFLRPLQAVGKYEAFHPNRSPRSSDNLHWTTLGLNWYIRENRIRLSSDYVFKRGASATKPNNAFEVQFQFFLY